MAEVLLYPVEDAEELEALECRTLVAKLQAESRRTALRITISLVKISSNQVLLVIAAERTVTTTLETSS